MRILMLFLGPLDQLPPLMTAAACMADCGAQVHVIASGGARESAQYLERHSVELSLVQAGDYPVAKFDRALLRLRVAACFRRRLRVMKPHCVWYHGPQAMQYAFLAGPRPSALVVAHAHELCDDYLFLGSVQRLVMRRADLVIAPEPNRLWMLKVASRSEAQFVCVPNRPLDDMLPAPEGDACTQRVFRERGGSHDCSRFIIYQGAFKDDRCLEQVVRAFGKLAWADVGLILMGAIHNDSLQHRLRQLAAGDRRIVFLSRVPPPQHLQITKGCVGGIMLYAPTCLNNVYCAPNKIYEYASMGLGIILPDYPGLAAIHRQFGIGSLCDPLDPTSIADAMMAVLNTDPECHRQAAKRFMDCGAKPDHVYSKIHAGLHELSR